MIIDTSNPLAAGPLTSAVLTKSARGSSSLSLSFDGFPPDWVQYMEPVTVIHHGRVLFHGKIKSLPASTSGDGYPSSSVTVDDVLWLLDHQTVSTQIAALRESSSPASSEAGGSVDSNAWKRALPRSFKELAASVEIEAPGWIPSPIEGEEVEQVVRMTASPALAPRVLIRRTNKVKTTFTALIHAQEANPDALLIVDHETGVVRFVSIEETDIVTLDSSEIRIISADGIEPQFESSVAGVILVNEGRIIYQYPEEFDPNDTNIKVLDVSGTSDDYPSIVKQWYAATNVLQWGGSVSIEADDLDADLLGKRINLTGPLMHEPWAGMEAVVKETTWDLLAGTVELSLGHDWSDPTFAEAVEGEVEDPNDDNGTTEDDMTTDEGDDFDGTTGDGGFTTGGFDPVSGVDSFDNTWPTSCATGTGSAPSVYVPPPETGGTGTGTGTIPVPSSQGPSPSSHGPSPSSHGPTPSSHGPTPSSQGPTPHPGSQGTGGSAPSQYVPSGGSGCPCGEHCPKLEQIRELIREAITAEQLRLGGSADSVAQTNANGTITVRTTWSYN